VITDRHQDMERSAISENQGWLKTISVRYLALFCLTEICLIALLYAAWQYNRTIYLENRSKHLQTAASSVVIRSEAVAHAITHEIIQQPEILKPLQGAINASEAQRKVIRKELYDKLYDTFQRLQKENPLLLQFILPDGTSLLRMHKPEHWGDQLF